MVALRYITSAIAVLLLALLPSGSSADASSPLDSSLFAQSATKVLEREFTKPELSFLLLDIPSGKLLTSRWEHPEIPIPMGSLVKPFTALAYGEERGFSYPAHVCHGAATGCWLPRGHGKINVTSAIAYSCNSYFRGLASGTDIRQVAMVASRFGLEAPAASSPSEALVGIGNHWKVSPLHMARAYVELVSRRDQPGIRAVVDGMALSARQGTGAAVDRALPSDRALAKTGTAPCSHATPSPGDGFTVTLWPATEPRILLLVRVHGVPGAEAAKTAGEMLRRIGE